MTSAASTSTLAAPKLGGAEKAAAKRVRRPRKRTGARAAQALKLIAAEPGITIPALGEKMGVKGNYLYTVVPSLERAGKVRKDGRGWYPKEATPASA